MSLKNLYQGREYSRDKNEQKYKQTLYGSEAEVDEYIASLSIGTKADGKGYLRSYTKTQKDGSFWQLEIEYSTSFSGSWSDDDETIVGQKSATLSARVIQVPLEAKQGYLTKWNNYLISTEGSAPAWAASATDIIIPVSDRGKYMWVKSLAEIPMDKTEQGKYWNVVQDMTKKGVEYFEVAVYVVSESAAFRSANAAGNFISKKMNKIVSPSQTFGLGGEWKLDDCSVQYDGKKWIATNTYSRAIDEWDSDLYD